MISYQPTNINMKTCPITQKGSKVAGRYSNRVRATQFNPVGKVRRYPNLQKKKIYIPELKKSMILEISTKAIKTIKKNGAYATLKKAGLI
jgi:large subunit ribosomal protein L28